MSAQLRTVLAIALLAGPILSACLPSTALASLGLTATASVQTTGVKVCNKIYSSFGYCVNQDDVITAIGNKMYQTARGILRNGDGAQNLLKQVNNRIDKIIANAKTVANSPALMNTTITSNTTAKARLLQTVTGTVSANTTANTTGATTSTTAQTNGTVKLPPPPAASSDRKANTKTVVVKNATAVGKVSAKNLNLKAETIAKLEKLKSDLTANQAILSKFSNTEARKACAKSLNKLAIGTMCIATSGAATTYVTMEGNKIASIQIAQSDAAAITTDCMGLIYQQCAVGFARDALKELANNGNNTNQQGNNGTRSNFAQVCDALAANPSCVQTPSSCSATIQTLVLKNMIRPGDNPMKTDFDAQQISDGIVILDSSLEATITAGGQKPARRLQTASSSSDDGPSYQTTSGAPSSFEEADKSNVPSDSVEDNIADEVPETAKGSGNAARLVIGLVLALAYSALV